MKKFRFKLETVLDVRKREEDAVVRELAEAQSRLAAVMDSLALCESRIAGQYEEIKKIFCGRAHIDTILNLQNYLKTLNREKAALIEKAGNIEEEILGIKQRLQEAMKKRKILEKLKENEYEKYRVEFNRQDDMLMDELNDNKQNRRL